jgi:hypothetical protein
MCRSILACIALTIAACFAADCFFTAGSRAIENQSAENIQGYIPGVEPERRTHRIRPEYPQKPPTEYSLDRSTCLYTSDQIGELLERSKLAAAQDGAQTWTFLFYDDADFTYAYDPYNDFVADAHSGDNVNVLVLRDRNDDLGRIWYVNRIHMPVFEDYWGEPDMGDYLTLRDFILYGKVHYPADRYILALYDHGGGWAGACVDVTNGGWLTMDDIKQAVSEAGNIDIICFTAPCLMGAVESIYELRDCVDIYIGSEELSGYAFWHGIMGNICDVLDNSSQLSNEDIGEMIIQFVAANQYWVSEHMTMSAVKASDVNNAVAQLDAFSQYALDNMPDIIDSLQKARSLAWGFGLGGEYEFVQEIDLYDFAAQFAALGTDSVLSQILQDLKDDVDAAVIAECHGTAQQGANGLSVYFPETIVDHNEDYPTVLLDMLEDTYWDEFLNLYLNYYVATLLQRYTSFWEDDCAKISWVLDKPGLHGELSFVVFRRTGGNGSFQRIIDPAITCRAGEYTFRDYSTRAGETYTYRVSILENNVLATSFDTELETPARGFALGQNYPNPFNQTTTIEFKIPQEGRAVLEIFDVSGRRVRVLKDRVCSAGRYVESWDGRSGRGESLASGLYFFRLTMHHGTVNKKCILLR